MPGQFYQQAMARLQQDRNNYAAMQLYLRKQEAEKQKDLAAKQFQRANMIFNHIASSLEGASPETAKYLLSEFSESMKYLERAAPNLAKALQVADPNRLMKLKNKAWVTNNPPPQRLPDDYKIENDPMKAINYTVESLRYKQSHAKQVLGRELPIQGYHHVGGKYGVYIKPDGSYQPVDWDMINEDPVLTEHRQKHGLSYMELMTNGGKYNTKTHTLMYTDKNGESYQEVWETSDNIFGTSKPTKLIGRPRQLGGTKPTHGEPPIPSERAKNFLIALQANRTPKPDEDPELRAFFKSLEPISKDLYKKWTKADGIKKVQIEDKYFNILEDRFRSIAGAGYSLVFVAPDENGALVRDWHLLGDGLKLADGVQVIPIYGSREFLKTADGIGIQFIIDRANNRAYFTNGQLVPGGTVKSAQELAGSMTLKQWQAYTRRGEVE